MDDERRLEILAAYELRASIFDEVARRRGRSASLDGVAVPVRPLRGLPSGNGGPPPELSSRLREVLRLIAEGESNKAIAARLAIGVETVKSHVHNLLLALEARNRAHAIAIAFRTGLLVLPERDEAA